MTQEQHPITPPLDLVQIWANDAIGPDYEQRIAIQSARWGADMELEECRKAIADQIITVDNIGLSGPTGVAHTKAFSSWPAFAQMVSRQLRAARRPKPPSLKAQALKALNEMNAPLGDVIASRCDTIRRALEALPD